MSGGGDDQDELRARSPYTPGSSPKTAGADRLWLLGLVALAIGLRVISWLRTTALFDDGPIFIYIAQAMQAGEWSAVLDHPYHPLYSLLSALIQPWFGDGDAVASWERAAVAVSVLAGGAAVAALFVFVRDAFGRSEARIAGVLLAIHPNAVAFSSDVQSDGLYMAFFLGAVALLWRVHEWQRPATAFGAGLLVAAAYLTRPEGLGLALLGAGVLVWAWLRGRATPRRAAALAACGLAGLLLASAPYLVALRVEGGEWMLTQKKSVTSLVRDSESSLASEARSVISPELPRAAAGERGRPADWRPSTELYRSLATSLRFEFWLFVLPGMILASLARPQVDGRGVFLGTLVVLYGAALVALVLAAGYVSRRHALPPLLPLLGYAALTVPRLGALLLRWLPDRVVSARMATATGLVLLALVALPRDLRERRGDELAERRAAEWLRERDPRAGAVAASRLRVAYYAGARYVPLPDRRGESLLDFLHDHGVRYVIADDDRLAPPEGAGLPAASARLLHRERAQGREAAVFELRPRARKG